MIGFDLRRRRDGRGRLPGGAGRAVPGRSRCRAALLAVSLLLPLAAAAQSITVSAAASLGHAFKEIGARFEAATPGATVRFNFAASGVLLQQIVQGAPVDVYASADQATMDRGMKEGLFDAGSRTDIAGNRVVLVVPAHGSSMIGGLEDLRDPAVRRIAIGKPATVPAGRYAREALESAALWPALEPKLVLADSVRQVLDYVSRGEVEAGFVYATDAALMPDRVRVALVASGHAPVAYPVAVVAESRQKALAARFLRFLATPAAREVLSRHGFGPASP
jgi:molybdate transport system substrate-binding protein